MKTRPAPEGNARPAANDRERALLEHIRSCGACTRDTALFGCEVGKALVRQFRDSQGGGASA